MNSTDKIMAMPEFDEFVRFVGLLVPCDVDTADGLLRAAISLIKEDFDDRLKRVRDPLLDDDFSEDELRRIWRSGGAIYHLVGEHAYHEFLDACRTAVTGGVVSDELLDRY